MTTSADPELYYEPFDKACRGNLYDLYARLRERAPVYKTPSGLFAVSRFADVQAILTDTATFSSRPNQDEATGFPTEIPEPDSEAFALLMPIVAALPLDPMELLTGRIIVAADPPQHTHQRNLVNRAFTPRRIASLRARIDELVTDCLTGIDRAETFEVVSQLSGVLPARVIAELLSIDDAHQHLVKKWTEDLAVAAATSIRGSAQAHARLFQMVKEVADYFVPLIEARRAQPTGDLISAIVAGEAEDSLSAAETVMFIVILITAGNGSTTNMIGNTVLALMQHRDQLDLLVEHPELIPQAIEESVRYRSPFQFIFREANTDIDLHGVTIPQGSVITVMTGAANHDPRHFEHPERFDIARPPTHTGFGRGPHFCLGANLARAQGIAVLEQLLPHLPDWELADEPLEEFPGLLDFGYTRIPLTRTGSARQSVTR